MNKPEDFDGVQAYGDYTPLPAGGYYCKVIKVEKNTIEHHEANAENIYRYS